ncbi:DNA cytosine methyltransferase [Crocosphaera chwakensis]|uniref:Cytosine-specific methyltransferase n=1 Tax=Crocosphaera chwakensis CCY0110 TaxID=391612 RepID=A3IS81_9CHRO|nr:DNA cytosine methyltransferase [Crocosphaera chwakensis]EAZ90597.1 site-specific DNA-methyltransferase [Crocosphaera chwakensis CCY0110]
MSTKITVREAASILKLTEQRVRTLCRNRLLQSQKIGRMWLIEEESMLQYGLRTAHYVAEDHPIYNNKKSRPIAISFFSGAMGLDLGIEQTGFDIKLACEIDKYCRQTITLNKPNIALVGDINSYSADDILSYAGLTRSDDIDLIVGGPPCQAFSTAGKRNGLNDNRGNIFLTYLTIIFDIRPKYFVIENVRGLLSCPLKHRPHNMRGTEFPNLTFDELPGGALNFVLSLVRNNGYSFSFNLYNSANFGTPQIRERVIIICSRNGEKPPFLVPTHSEKGQYGLKKWKTFRQATKGISTHHHLTFPEKRLKYYKMLSEGQNWKSLPKNLQKEALGKSYYAGGGKTGFLRRLSWNKPSPTLVTHPAMPATDLAHPQENRPLSIEEYKRIQEFPDDWQLAGPLIQQYKQIGNAVPISLGKAVGLLIMKLLNQENIPDYSNFSFSRYKNTSDTEWQTKFESTSSNL